MAGYKQFHSVRDLEQKLETSDASHLDELWEVFARFLRDNGARLTRSRRVMFDHVMKRPMHFSAEQLAFDLGAPPHNISRGTVYRTLTLMAQSGFVRTFRDTNMRYTYESILGKKHHEHLVCEECGRLIEFSDDKLHDRLMHITGSHNFCERSHTVVVFGVCPDCRNLGRKC